MLKHPAAIWRYNPIRRQNLGKRARLKFWTQVYGPPSGLEAHAPYYIGLVELETGQCCTVQLTDIYQQPVEGMSLIGRLRRLYDVADDAVVVYGIKFAPERKAYES